MTEAALLPIARTVSSLRAHVAAWRETGQTVALVPTMGALHEGHLSLVRMAKAQADRVVATIFVNPRQFGPNEDFDAYPRGEAADAALLTAEGCDLLYAPQPAEMYPPGFATTVSVAGLTDVLCGAARPGHFDGVATVVTKLFTQAEADVAIFGEKDFQQLQLIKRLARDLDLRIEVLGAPTLRAPDGLALSSRNAYLSDAERAVAGTLNLVLKQAAAALSAGEPVEPVESRAKAAVLAAGFDSLDYLEVRATDGLARQGPGPVAAPSRVFVAARLGKTRLIDNIAV